MKNIILNRFDNTINLKITGRNVDRFIERIYKLGIELLEVNKISRKEVNIKIYEYDYEKIIEIKSIYDIKVTGSNGIDSFLSKIKKNKYLIILFIIGYFMILFLSNIVFDIQVVHSNSNIRNLVMKELEKNGIKKYTFKKKYDDLENITNKILEDNKDSLEWMEIEVSGTKLIVKIEERKLNEDEKTYPKQDIVAKKSGIIRSVKSSEGVILKNVNDYVKKGDVIISGTIMDTYGENVKAIVSAKGSAYAEVWYTVSMEMPLIYNKTTFTNKQKRVYKIQFLNNKISLFDFNKYKNYEEESKVLLESRLLPIKFLKVKEYETRGEDSVFLPEEALIKANQIAKEKIESTLKKDEYIIDQKNLKFYQKDSKIVLEIFFSVCERIDTTKEIKESEIIKDKKE